MSKKYVPSFLKQGELPSSTIAPFDAFASNKHQKEKTAAFDAFPMNKRGAVRNENEFDAFSKVKKLPEVDAFSAFNSTRKFGVAGAGEGTTDAFAAFGSKTRGGTDAGAEDGHDFPMSKRTGENRPPKGDGTRGVRNPHLVFEPLTYGGALISTPTKKTAAVVVVSGKTHGAEEAKTADAMDDSSFAAKFATKMKIVEDPSYVPPPTVVDMESEQDFPTLGMVGAKSSQGWAQPLRRDEWTQPVQKATVSLDTEPIQKTKKVPKKTAEKKIVPVIPRRATKTQEESKEDGEFKPIEYEEDAFDEDEALDASDLDEEALFADDDGEEEDDDLDPNVYENRRPDDLY